MQPRGGAAQAFPWGRALLLLPLAYWSLALATGASSWCFLDLVNLAFHEAGHLFLSFAGKTIHYLGGTIGQIAVPAFLAGYFLVKQRQPFAAAVCSWWLGESLVNVAVYMADARSLALPLVGGGDHDWNELFYRFGILSEGGVGTVSALTHLVGSAVMFTGLGWAAFFLLPEERRRRLRDAAAARWPWLQPALDS